MRYIKRSAKPNILIKNANAWLNKFLASGTARPKNGEYRHQKIKDALFAMSSRKCFYCETALGDDEAEVEHFIEIAVDKNKAFEWDNLYLSCKHCNGKLPENQLSVDLCLDPCKDLDDEIEKHLCFEDEQIKAVPNSQKGLDTIRKFKLDDDVLDKRRGRKLQEFYKHWKEGIFKTKNRSNKSLLAIEKILLENYASPDRPFSLMFRLLLKET